MKAPRGRRRTPQAVRASLNARLRNAAEEREGSADELRKQFVFALLFRRLFRDDDGRWIVLGGNALLLRTGGGRFTQDVDLSPTHDWQSEDGLKDELEEIVSRDVGDPFLFLVTRIDPHDRVDQYGYGTRTAKAYITVLLGGTEFDTFTIDIAQRRHVEGPVDYLDLDPIIDDEFLTDLPRIPVIPIENHTADKICALYEVHQQQTSWSTRYRDLADLVRIVRDIKIDAELLASMLRHEQERRQMPELPDQLRAPHESWAVAYPEAARGFAGFPSDLHPLEASLAYAGRCLNVVLDGTRVRGTWDPARQQWYDEPFPGSEGQASGSS